MFTYFFQSLSFLLLGLRSFHVLYIVKKFLLVQTFVIISVEMESLQEVNHYDPSS